MTCKQCHASFKWHVGAQALGDAARMYSLDLEQRYRSRQVTPLDPILFQPIQRIQSDGSVQEVTIPLGAYIEPDLLAVVVARARQAIADIDAGRDVGNVAA